MARAIDWSDYDTLNAQGLGDREIARQWGNPLEYLSPGEAAVHPRPPWHTSDSRTAHHSPLEYTNDIINSPHPSTPKYTSPAVHFGTPGHTDAK